MAYTVLDITTGITDDLKDPSFSTTRILRYLNAAQRLIFNNHTFRFTETSASATLMTGDSSKAQLTDHQATIHVILTDPDNDDQHYVFDERNYLPFREFFEMYPVPANNAQSVPVHWTEYGGNILFSCPIDDDYEFLQRYYKTPAELTGTSDIPSVPGEFRELIEMFILYRAEKYRQNHDVAATYKQEFEEQLEAMTIRYSPAVEVGFHTMGSSRTRIEDA